MPLKTALLTAEERVERAKFRYKSSESPSSSLACLGIVIRAPGSRDCSEQAMAEQCATHLVGIVCGAEYLADASSAAVAIPVRTLLYSGRGWHHVWTG